jgi:predicted outer membrane protein
MLSLLKKLKEGGFTMTETKNVKKSDDLEKTKTQDTSEISDRKSVTETVTREENKAKIKLLVTEVSDDILRGIIEKLLSEDDFDLNYILDRMIKDSSVTLQLRKMTQRDDINPEKKHLSATLLREIEDIRAKKS